MNFVNYFKKKHSNVVPFVSFMQEALYAPNIGYYNSSENIFGQNGDFVTDPELTPLFGYTVANQCAEVLVDLTNSIIFEFNGIPTIRIWLNALTFQFIDETNGKMILYGIRQMALVVEIIPHNPAF